MKPLAKHILLASITTFHFSSCEKSYEIFFVTKPIKAKKEKKKESKLCTLSPTSKKTLKYWVNRNPTQSKP